MAASAESFDNRHSSSTFYGPGANSPLLSFQQVLFYRGLYNNRQNAQLTELFPPICVIFSRNPSGLLWKNALPDEKTSRHLCIPLFIKQTLMQSLTKPARIIIKILSYKVLKVKKNVRRQAPYKYNFAGLYS